MNKPYREFFSIKFRIFTKYRDYEMGIRKVAIEWDTKPKGLITDDCKWVAPIIQWKFIIGAILISGIFPWGKITEYK